MCASSCKICMVVATICLTLEETKKLMQLQHINEKYVMLFQHFSFFYTMNLSHEVCAISIQLVTEIPKSIWNLDGVMSFLVAMKRMVIATIIGAKKKNSKSFS